MTDKSIDREASPANHADTDRSDRPTTTGSPVRISPERKHIASALKDRDQWVAWKCYDDGNATDARFQKIPLSPRDGRPADPVDPETWGSFEAAWTQYDDPTTAADGVGYVFTEDDPFVGIDLDDCRDPDTGALDATATSIINRLESYTYVSSSGTGVHIIVTGEKPDGPSRLGPTEMYDTKRYFAVTGVLLDDAAESHAIANPQARPAQLAELVVQMGESAGDVPRANASPTDRQSGLGRFDAAATTRATGNNLGDDEVLECARAAKNAKKFARLWKGDTRDYPSRSEATLALCRLLAFYTGGDRAQMDRLVRRSGLMREKWDSPRGNTTWGAQQIGKAVADQDEFYTGRGAHDC